MVKYSVLICDDNEIVHTGLASYLKAEGIRSISVYDGESALKTLQEQSIDIVVLDVMLPNMDGFEVCREIRRRSKIPIIMLSARSEEIDRIVGLELGADDYVTKPFSPREVVVRIKKVLNRLSSIPDIKKLTLAELTVFPDSYQVFVNNEEIFMTAKEVDVLAFMLCHVGKVLTREHILSVVWGYNYCGDIRAVDTVVKRIRQKLPKDIHASIRSVYSIGYKIEGIP